MTREEQIDWLCRLRGRLEITPAPKEWRDNCKQALSEAIKALEQESKWIPVSERLPEEFESVLVCYESQGGIAQAVSERFGTHTGYRWSALAGIEPIAWMLLPEPYKAER